MKNSGAMNRRQFIKVTSATAAATYMTASPWITERLSRAYASDAKKIKIGVVAPSHCALPLVYAQISDVMKNQGLDAEIIYKPDMPDVAKAILTKEVDLGQLITPVFYALHAGAGPFKDNATPMVTAQFGGTNGGVLVVKNDSAINDPKDLKGKSIGVHSKLMVHSLLINELLARNGLNPANDLNIKVIPMSKIIESLKNGEIDAFINPEPLGTVALNQGVGRELMLTKRLWFKHPCCLIAMRKDYFDEDPARAKVIYTATTEAGLMLNDPQKREEGLAKINSDSEPYKKIPKEVLSKAFTPGRTDFDPFPYQSSGKAVLTMMQQWGALPAGGDLDAMVSATILSDLSREIMTSLKASPPGDNKREEKIVGKVFA